MKDVYKRQDKTEAKPGETITLTAIASHDIKGLPCTYVWDKDGKEIKGETGSTLKVTENGNYSVKVMITDAEGLTAEGMSKEVKCTFSDLSLIHIFSKARSVMPNSSMRAA